MNSPHGAEVTRYVKISDKSVQTITIMQDGCIIAETRYTHAMERDEHTRPDARDSAATRQELINSGYLEDF